MRLKLYRNVDNFFICVREGIRQFIVYNVLSSLFSIRCPPTNDGHSNIAGVRSHNSHKARNMYTNIDGWRVGHNHYGDAINGGRTIGYDVVLLFRIGIRDLGDYL